MNIDLSKYTIQELTDLKNKIDNYIYNYEDGYLYICQVRSYGRNWKERPKNLQSLRDLCHHYNGDDGIVDIYTTNPTLGQPETEFYNYGDTFYIKSEEDYQKDKDYKYLKYTIESLTKEWEKWDNRENVPFKNRPIFDFEPHISKEELEKMKKEYEDTIIDWVEPIPVFIKDFTE